ncbi:MAG: cupin-like domain-containing protein [Myxococcota bacterium]
MRASAWGAALVLSAWTLLANGFGVVPLFSRSLSRVPADPPGPTLSRSTAFAFRWLVLWRWLRGDNEVACGIARRYVRRARCELAEEPSAPGAEPVFEASQEVDDLPRLARSLRGAPRPVVLRQWHRARRDWSLDALVGDAGQSPVLMRGPEGFSMRPLAGLRETPGAYVANCEQLLVRHPELVEALDPHGDSGAWLGGVAYALQLFVGARPGTGLSFHCANNWNLFTMLHGRKRWTFVDPAHGYLMYPWTTRDGAYVASVLHHPQLDPGACDLFEWAPRSSVVLEPGDVLVSPPWWWHRVENLDAETVGAAHRRSIPFAADTNRLFSFAQALSPGLLAATAGTLAEVIAHRARLRDLYAGSGAGPTAIERVAHTREQLMPAEAGVRAWGGAPGRRAA